MIRNLRYIHPNDGVKVAFVKRMLSFTLFCIWTILSTSANGQLTANFISSDTAGCAPLIVHFTNASTGATSYSWNLGNGTISTLTDVSASYTSPGTYTVTLTAFNSGSSTTYTQIVRTYAAPAVSFSANDSTVCKGAPITFTSSSISNAWGPLSYTWNFGDGNSSTANSPVYSYPSAGNYNVTLFAKNKPGCISSLGKPGYIYVSSSSVVDFLATTTHLCIVPSTILFTNSSTGIAPLSYTWSFGDGGTSIATVPTHTYTSPGSYSVALKATNGYGCKDSIVKYGYINAGNFKAQFSYPPNGCRLSSITFNDVSSPHISSQWDFGDGGTSTANSPIYAYNTAGTYKVKLVVYDGTCYDSVTHVINITVPSGDFTIFQPCIPKNKLDFNAVSVSPGAALTWQFGDGATASGPAVSHIYADSTRPKVRDITMTLTNSAGCVNTVTKKDTLKNPFVDLHSPTEPEDGCIPLKVDFGGLFSYKIEDPFPICPTCFDLYLPYPYPATSYTWDFGDGSPSSTGANPAHTYTAVGKYMAKCTAIMSNGCRIADSIKIVTGTKQHASFTISPLRACTGVPIHVVSTSSDTNLIDDINWAWMDGGGDKGRTATHSYKVPGLIDVQLSVTYNGCRSDWAFHRITIDPPGALIHYTYPCIPYNAMQFGDSSVKDDTHLWSFGDGSTSTLKHPIHNYSALSTYRVILTTTNTASGCTAADTIPLHMQRLGGHLKPYHNYICTETPDTITNAIVNIIDTPTMTPIRITRQAAWYVNNSLARIDTPVYTNPPPDQINMSDTTSFAFHTRGFDTIAVVLTDNYGCEDTFSTNIVAARPKADFNVTGTTGCAPITTTFTDLSTDVPGVRIMNYAWTFGDTSGATTGKTYVVHTYTAGGAYNVIEIVTDSIGCSDIKRDSVPLFVHKPKASFSVNSTSVCLGGNANFNNYSTGSSRYLWSFGDGATSTQGLPIHSYTATGTYTVSLIANDAFGCSDTSVLPAYITVNPLPAASFTMDDSFAVCPPLNVNFTNTSIGSTSSHWSFGDGTFSLATNPNAIYTASALYRIKLVSVNSFGCIDSAIGHASIFGYAGAFSYAPSSVCTSSPVHFKAVMSGVTNVVWDFNDGILSSGSLLDTISHGYSSTGYYIPTLILTDSFGCTSFSTGIDTIKADTIIAGFSFPATTCQNAPTTFIDSSVSYFSRSGTWLWSFGTGATSSGDTAVYTFSVSGTYPVTLSVTNGNGCTSTISKNIIVNSAPAPITGLNHICIGQPDTLRNATTGGTWSSGNTTIATIDTAGVVTGTNADTVAINYTISNGCKAATNLTVSRIPSPIIGSNTICRGFTNRFSDAVAGGSWSSSDTTVATIGMLNGVVTGIASGTTTITYQLANGCPATINVKVDTTPVQITVPGPVCVGATITLTDSIGGGSWLCSNTAIATIDAATGELTPGTTGTFSIVYILRTGCNVTKTLTANPAPLIITGPGKLCIGSKISLSDASPGGKWSSSKIPVAPVVVGSGLVSGLSAGTATISYTIGSGCAAIKVVSVNPIPSPILGTSAICIGVPVFLRDADTGGFWASAISSVATIDSFTGAVTGLNLGTTTITYTLGTGCKTTASATVKPMPAPVTGTTRICAGATTMLSDAALSGTWSSGNTLVATVAIGSGIATGILFGTAIISYTLTNGCIVTAALTVDSLPLPVAVPPWLCVGDSDTLTNAGAGTWSSGNPAIAAIGSGTGIVTGMLAGNAAISYALPTGCKTFTTLTIAPLPSPISGKVSVCVNTMQTLSNADAGGAWNLDATTIASIDSVKGIVTGISPGNAIITYTLPTGCKTIKTATINALPASITGNNICVNLPTTFSDSTAGGSWASADATIKVGSATGIVTGVAAGTATLTYILATGCTAISVVPVYPLPSAITGEMSICTGITDTLQNITAGGKWSIKDTFSIIDPVTGVFSSSGTGTAIITYTLPTGCYVTTTATVNPVPSPIAGTTWLCKGAATVLSDSVSMGTWSSSSTSVATIDADGKVSGLAAGTAVITYTTAEKGCMASTTVSVYPFVDAISGETVICAGTATTLSNTISGGAWSSSDTLVLSIDPSGIARGKATGIATVSYSAANACGSATLLITVNPQPEAGVITGKTQLCTGTTEILTDTTTGGVWTTANNNIANVSATGLLTALTAGVTPVYYSYTNSCGTARAEVTVTVNQTPNSAHIVTHPGSQLCTNTLFQNFGADSPEPAGGFYMWQAENAIVHAVSKNKQYCLVSFPAPGAGMVTLSAKLPGADCASMDTVVFDIATDRSPVPVVVYYPPEFVCKDNTADSYQWGWDDAATLDSSLFFGMVNQNYYNKNPDFTRKYYWVITDHKGCLQKSYYNAPLGVTALAEGNAEIRIFPNPAGSVINIEIQSIATHGIVSAVIYDMLGKERKTGAVTNGAGSIRLNGLAPGVYLITLTSDGLKIGSKIFVKEK